MKKLLLATAIAALSVSAANAAPTVYGKAFLHADYVNGEVDNNAGFNNDDNSLQINSTGSKIGVKGSEAMTANTDVVYQLEYSIDVDGDRGTLNARDTYLGLANKKYGTFRFGRNYSVSDYINNVTRNEGYWDNIGSSTTSDNQTLANALTLTDGDRINNSVVWMAPKYNNLPLELALQYGSDETLNNDNDSGFGASLMYNPGQGFTAGIAIDDDMSVNGQIVRGTASVDLGKYMAYPITLSALYQQVDFDGGLNDQGVMAGNATEDGLVISADMMLPNFSRPMQAYIQYDKTDNLGGIHNYDSNQIVVGGKYEYRTNMIAHGYAGVNSADLGGTDADVLAIGGGLEYLF